MSSGKLINGVQLGRVIASMKIPVGGDGNTAITPAMLRNYVNSSSIIYETTNTSIVPENGLIQDLTLETSGVLSFNSQEAQLVFLRITGNNPLNYSQFVNINDWQRDPAKKSFVVLLTWIGVQYIFGYDYEQDEAKIHCEGAQATYKHIYAFPTGSTPIDFQARLFIDGIEISPENTPSWFTGEPTDEEYPYPIPDGYTQSSRVFLSSNKDTVNHKIEMVMPSGTNAIVLPFGNDSIIDMGSVPHKHVGFCLTPDTAIPVGCEGATSIMNFSHVTGTFELYINGAFATTGSAGEIQNYLFDRFGETLVAGFDGFWYWQNYDPVNYYKIELIAQGSYSFEVIDSNPTFIEMPDRGCSFCLKPYKEEFDCEGATQSITVSMFISSSVPEMTVTVNGVSKVYVDQTGNTTNFETWFNSNFGSIMTVDISDFSTFTNVDQTACNNLKVVSDGFAIQEPSQIDMGTGFNETFRYNEPSHEMSFNLGASSTISCEGATQGARLGNVGTNYSITIDGQPAIPSDDNGEWAVQVYSQKIAMDSFPDQTAIWNFSEASVRVSIQADPTQLNPNDQAWSDTYNPTTNVNFQTGLITFCLSIGEPTLSMVFLNFEDKVGDTFGLILATGFATVNVEFPDGSFQDVYVRADSRSNHISFMEGRYKMSHPFTNVNTDIYFCAKIVDENPPKPTMTSITRLPSGKVRLVGTSKPNTAIQVSNQEFYTPFAYGWTDSTGTFDFEFDAPIGISGSFNCQEGGFFSQPVYFTI